MENIKPTSVFPVECLPNKFRRYIEAVAEHTQTPVDMVSVAVLAVVATTIQGKFEIKQKEGHTEPTNVYVLIIAMPAERKSAIIRLTTKPLYEYEKEENEKRQVIIDRQRLEIFSKQKELDNKLKKIENLEESISLQAEIRKLEKEQIKLLRLTADDCTSEALTSLLADNDGKISVISAEGGIFDILNGKYNNSKATASIDTFLKAHCGDRIQVDRKGRESEYIDKPTMTVLLAVQEIVLEGLISNNTFRGKGLTARFLYCNPTSTLGTRKFETKEIPSIAEEEYNTIIYKLLDLPKEEKPKILELSSEAYKELKSFHNWLEPQLVNELEFMQDWAGKLEGTCLRIAGILHCMEYSNIKSDCLVSLDTVKKAITISRYFLEHSKYAYMLMGEDKETQKAKYILNKLEKQDKMSLKRNEIATISRSSRRNIKNADDIIRALEILVENGYIFELEAEEREGKKGRKPDPVFELNPLYFKK